MIDKFLTIRDYAIDYLKSPQFVHNKKYNLCVAYCLFGDSPDSINTTCYSKLLYLSLLSQYKNTDIADVDVKIFITPCLEAQLKELLSAFPVEFIPIPEKFNKYTITLHPALTGYDKIILCDADTFLVGKPTPLYYNFFHAYPGIYMLPDINTNSLDVFLARIVLSETTSETQYTELVAQSLGVDETTLLEYLTNNHWFLSCFMLFDNFFYSGPNWTDYANKANHVVKTWCDETVFLTYGWKNNFSFRNFEELDIPITYAHLWQDYSKTDFMNGNLSIVHPLHGTYCHNMSVQTLYELIQNV